MASNQDYNQTITAREMEDISMSITNSLESDGVDYVLQRKGIDIKPGKAISTPTHYVVELVSSYDDEDICLERVIIDKQTKECITELSGGYLITMYDAAVNKLKEKYNKPLAEFEAELENYTGELVNTKIMQIEDKRIQLFSYDFLHSDLHYISKMAVLYADKLSEKSSELVYYSTLIMNDLIEARNIVETIAELDVDLEATPIPLKNYLNSNILPVLAGINIISELAKDVDAELWTSIYEMNPDFEQKKENLERVLKYY